MALVRSAAAEGPDEARLDLWLLLDAHAHHLGTILLHLPHHEMRHWLLCRLRPCHQQVVRLQHAKLSLKPPHITITVSV
jgi:hypothetical protein